MVQDYRVGQEEPKSSFVDNSDGEPAKEKTTRANTNFHTGEHSANNGYSRAKECGLFIAASVTHPRRCRHGPASGHRPAGRPAANRAPSPCPTGQDARVSFLVPTLLRGSADPPNSIDVYRQACDLCIPTEDRGNEADRRGQGRSRMKLADGNKGSSGMRVHAGSARHGCCLLQASPSPKARRMAPSSSCLCGLVAWCSSSS